MPIVKYLKNIGLLLVFLGAVVGFAGCPQSATPPSGPAEIPGPAALQFPSSVTIDVTTTSTGELAGLKTFFTASGEFSDEISIGSDLVLFVQEFVNHVISSEGILGGVVVAIDPSITYFTTTVPGTSEFLPGEEVKIDFAKFSSAKSETNECSESTAGDIVCYRVWVAGQRFLAGFFTSLPTEAHNGAGHFWFVPPEVLFPEGEKPTEQIFQMGLSWDHTDPADKTTEMFFGGGLKGTTSAQNGRGFLRQQGADASTAVKTVKATASFSDFGGQSGNMKYVGRWKEDEDFWSGKVDFEFGPMSQENLDICARLSTGNGADDANCAAIDTDDEAFLDLASPEDFTFPTDFPSSPAF